MTEKEAMALYLGRMDMEGQVPPFFASAHLFTHGLSERQREQAVLLLELERVRVDVCNWLRHLGPHWWDHAEGPDFAEQQLLRYKPLVDALLRLPYDEQMRADWDAHRAAYLARHPEMAYATVGGTSEERLSIGAHLYCDGRPAAMPAAGEPFSAPPPAGSSITFAVNGSMVWAGLTGPEAGQAQPPQRTQCPQSHRASATTWWSSWLRLWIASALFVLSVILNLATCYRSGWP